MNVIDKIMQQETAIWISKQIIELPDRAKFRAFSAIRSLQWANNIYASDMPIPACFCALHATEEAVAAFISCAKVCGYKDARKINITNHMHKATISLLAQKVSDILSQYQVAVALNPENDGFVARYTVDDKTLIQRGIGKAFPFPR